MTNTEKQLIERYVYAVTKRLPQSQREDVGLELSGLIEEMAQDRPVEQILQEMGDPALLADSYRGAERYLVGPNYFDFYLLVLKIVGFAVTLGISIALGIGFLFNTPSSVGTFFTQLVGTLFGAYAQAFAWVTITFWIIEWQQKRRGVDAPLEQWSLESLPDVPSRSTIIPRSEPIASLVFLVLIFAGLNSAPWILRVTDLEKSIHIVSPFVPHVFQRMLVLINLTIVIAMGIEFAKLYTGVQSKRLAVLTIGLKFVSLAISLYIVAGSGLWNPNFVQEMRSAMKIGSADVSVLQRLWSYLPTFLVIVMVLGFVVETVQTLWRTWHLKLPEKNIGKGSEI
jgi:hypothetical protein